MDERMLLGRRVKELRQMRGWSQEELAEKMGINAKYLSSVERGLENPTLDLLIKLANALKIELVAVFNYAWLALSEAELRKRIRAMADQADLETLREMLALMKARGL